MNVRTRFAGMIMLIAGASSAATAQTDGEVLFTDNDPFGDAVRRISAPLSVDTLVSFADPDTRLAGITRKGGRYFLANGPLPPQAPSLGSILAVDGMFSGAPLVSVLALGDPIQNPIGLAYDAPSDTLLAINNPGTIWDLPTRFEGVLQIGLDGSVTELFAEGDLSEPNPHYEAAARLTKDPLSDDYFIACVNGGTFDPGTGPDDQASTIWRLDVSTGTVSLFADLSATTLPGPLTFVRGITATPDGDLYITDRETGGVYRITQDAGGLFDSIEQIASGFDGASVMEFNRYNNRLVLSADDLDQIWDIRLDGTSARLLADGVNPRGLYIVPAPGVLGLAGLALLAAARRGR